MTLSPTSTETVDLSPAGGGWDDAIGTLSDIAEDLIAAIPNILVGLAVLTVFYLLGRLVRAFIQRKSAMRRRQWRLAIVTGRIVHGIAIILGALIAAVVIFPNFTPTQMLQFLGVGSIAIGFAFRNILENYLAGILLLTSEPFRIDDQITYKEFEGTVEEIQTRATFIRTYDGRRVVIPNGELFTNAVLVNTAFAKRRIEYDIGIGYGDDVAKAKQLILEAIQSVQGVASDPAPDVLTWELGPHTVSIRARWWIQPPRRADALDSRNEVLAAIKARLTANGIDLPFPTHQVLFHDQTEESDGDRSAQREGWPAGTGEVPKARSIARALATSAPRRQQD